MRNITIILAFLALLATQAIAKNTNNNGDLFLPKEPSSKSSPSTSNTNPAQKISNSQPLTGGAGHNEPYTETEYQSWGDRLANSWVTFLFGFVLIIFSIPFLWFNERRSVEVSRLINRGAAICQEAKPEIVESDLNGELVHICGKIGNSKIIHDEDFGVTADNSVKLRRVVEVYQVQERSSSKTKKDQIGGGQTTTTTYGYDHVWSEVQIDSSKFKDARFKGMNSKVNFICHNQTFVAESVQLGHFKLNESQKQRLNNYEAITLHSTIVNSFSRRMRELINKLNWGSPNIYVDGNCIYIRQSHSQTPQVGDIRVSFKRVPCDMVTIVAQQSGSSFEPYDIRNRDFRLKSDSETARLLDEQNRNFCTSISQGCDSCCWTCCCCFKCMDTVLAAPSTIDWIYAARMTKQEVFRAEAKQNECLTITFRILGIIALSLGISMLFEPVLALTSVVKIFADILGFGVLVVSFLIGIVVGLIVIALAWIFYRPFLALGLLVLAGAIWGLFYLMGDDEGKA